MAAEGGGGEEVGGGGVTRRCKRDFGPWFKSQKSLISFFFKDDGQKFVDKK
jgi:hypothetical protein